MIPKADQAANGTERCSLRASHPRGQDSNQLHKPAYSRKSPVWRHLGAGWIPVPPIDMRGRGGSRRKVKLDSGASLITTAFHGTSFGKRPGGVHLPFTNIRTVFRSVVDFPFGIAAGASCLLHSMKKMTNALRCLGTWNRKSRRGRVIILREGNSNQLGESGEDETARGIEGIDECSRRCFLAKPGLADVRAATRCAGISAAGRPNSRAG